MVLLAYADRRASNALPFAFLSRGGFFQTARMGRKTEPLFAITTASVVARFSLPIIYFKGVLLAKSAESPFFLLPWLSLPFPDFLQRLCGSSHGRWLAQRMGVALVASEKELAVFL